MKEYLTTQIITYMGNKRKLLHKIEDIITDLETREGGRKLTIGDGFSGSGIVSRLFKLRAQKLFTNDISDYSNTLNRCYLMNINPEEEVKIKQYIQEANDHVEKKTSEYNKPFISGNWAPIGPIKKGDRVYFTEENGIRIDIYRNYIETIPEQYRSFLLAPLLVESSIHNNTNGQFSAFYKNADIGEYGGKNGIDLKRITQPITLQFPVYVNNSCEMDIRKMDVNQWIRTIPEVDLMYFDPPYNKHPYSIFYFMLNIINNWNRREDIPNTYRGQPLNWEKSLYNSSKHAEKTLEDLILTTKAKYILLSYNSSGIISHTNMKTILEKYGDLEIIYVPHKTYNRLKGISEYKREKPKEEIQEYFWLLHKKKV
jgi:adenine-specific DNA-methyltransferase